MTSGPVNAQALLQILFIADQHVDMFDDAAEGVDRPVGAAGRGPQLLAVVEIERDDGAVLCAASMASMISSEVVSESDAKIPPLWNQRTPVPKILSQSKSPGLSWAAASLQRL